MSDALLAQAASGLCGVFGVLVYLAILVFVIAGAWKTFAKAGQPGWAIFVPFYNAYVMCKIAGKPGWWLVLMFVPVLNIVITAIISIDIARAFGKGTGFGIGLWLLSFVFYPILGFGDAQYQGPSH